MAVVSNPILPGFHPDPSVCRRGDDYFLVVSSFAYWPAIPVFHSTNLADWTPIGHVADRLEQLDLHDVESSDGVWAPTIRYHDGEFFVVVSIARGRRGERTLLFTASDPAGPWSTPIDLHAEGIDPSLFFDDDGRAWFTACRDAHEPEHGPAEIFLQEFGPRSRSLVGPIRTIWRGFARDAWIEAPHLYRSVTGYQLVGAEGGTERHHSVTGASAAQVTGPYRSDPRSPLLTHRHLGADAPIQNIGHMDLVDTPSGEVWAVVLGTRPVDGHHVLGRETFLVPATWDEGGLVLAPGIGRVTDVVDVPGASGSSADVCQDDRFDDVALGREWISLRGPVESIVETRAVANAGLLVRAGIELHASAGTPSFLGRRQQHHRFTASVSLRLDRVRDAAAGIAIVQSEHRYVSALFERRTTGEFQLRVTLRIGGEQRVLCVEPLDPRVAVGRITVEGDHAGYRIRFEGDGRPAVGDAAPSAAIAAATLSTEAGGGFVGVVLGPYVEGRGAHGEAVIDRFTYRGDADGVPAFTDEVFTDEGSMYSAVS